MENMSVTGSSLATFFKTRIWILFAVLFIGSSFLYALHTYQAKSVLWGDTRYYYAYTRSILVDHDINFENEAFLSQTGFPNQPVFSPKTNRVINKFSPGAPILWIPGFIAGQILTLLPIFSQVKTSVGYSWITQFAVGLSAVGFSVAGLYIFFKSIKRVFGTRIAVMSAVILFISTQLFFYTALDPLNSHSASFLFSSLLFFFANRWLFIKNTLTVKQVLILGFIAGWLALIRNQDVIFCVPVGLAILFKEKQFIRNIFHSILFSFAAILPLLIQLSFTDYLYGQYRSPYSLGGEKLNWLHPDFVRVLFSHGNGFLFFAPITLFFLWGIIRAVRQSDSAAKAVLLAFILATYVIACWGPEILGGPYGSRMFTSTLPWLGYGAAVIINEYWSSKKKRSLILLLIFVCSINTIAQTFYMLLTH